MYDHYADLKYRAFVEPKEDKLPDGTLRFRIQRTLAHQFIPKPRLLIQYF
jgi:hypothetical protein